jgi:hypothetical protein
MKLALIVLLVGGSWGSAWARLGDTRDEAEARYGLEKHEGVKLGQIPLLQGAKEITFEYWRMDHSLCTREGHRWQGLHRSGGIQEALEH